MRHRAEGSTHFWIWYYRATSAYIAIMVTVVVVLLIKAVES